MNGQRVSYVVMTWNRTGERLERVLASLLKFQTVRPREVIVVDTSTNREIAQDVARTVSRYTHAILRYRSTPRFMMSWAFNFGIKSAHPESDIIATVSADIMYGRKMTEAILVRLERQPGLVMAATRRLPSEADLTVPFFPENWKKLCVLAAPWGVSGRGTGTVQAAHREWWWKVGGYDEAYVGGLGGPDTDLMERARLDGQPLLRIPWTEVQTLHQWHPVSSLKGKCAHIYVAELSNRPVVKNLNGWGEDIV